MRRFLTLGFKKNGQAEIIHDSDKPAHVHLGEFKKLLNAGKKKLASETKGFVEIAVIDTSRGGLKSIKFGDPADTSTVGKVRRSAKGTGNASKKTSGKSAARKTAAKTDGAPAGDEGTFGNDDEGPRLDVL